MSEFSERLLEQQKKNDEIWMKEFERNGNSTKSVWDVEPSSLTGSKEGKK